MGHEESKGCFKEKKVAYSDQNEIEASSLDTGKGARLEAAGSRLN